MLHHISSSHIRWKKIGAPQPQVEPMQVQSPPQPLSITLNMPNASNLTNCSFLIGSSNNSVSLTPTPKAQPQVAVELSSPKTPVESSMEGFPTRAKSPSGFDVAMEDASSVLKDPKAADLRHVMSDHNKKIAEQVEFKKKLQRMCSKRLIKYLKNPLDFGKFAGPSIRGLRELEKAEIKSISALDKLIHSVYFIVKAFEIPPGATFNGNFIILHKDSDF